MTTLVGAGAPPTRVVVVQEDVETYFLRLVDHDTSATPHTGS